MYIYAHDKRYSDIYLFRFVFVNCNCLYTLANNAFYCVKKLAIN